MLFFQYRGGGGGEGGGRGGGRGGGGGRCLGKGLHFEWPYFCQYSSELHQICSSCVLCGYRINFKIAAHLHNIYHYYPEFHADQACFHGKASF